MKFDLIINGAGLAGASLAVALRDSGLKIALIEAQAPFAPQGWDARIYAISAINQQYLEEIGVWQHLDQNRIAPVYDMEVCGDMEGRLDFSAYDSGLTELAWIMEASLMARELWETAKRQSNVTLFCPAKPESLSLDEDAARLTLADGRLLEAKLIVGADGRQSWVREAAGIHARFSDYDEKGVVANFRTEKPHRGVACQWFRNDGILAYLPLPGNLMSIVWSAPTALADELLALPPEDFCQRVQAAGFNRLGKLELETAPQGFALKLMRVSEVVKPRLALIGDAAHAIHPLSGHGINLGFQDARVLAEVLRKEPACADIGALNILKRYSRSRAEETAITQYTTHALNRLFKPRIPALMMARNLGLSLTNRIPVVKNLLTRYAVNGHF